MTSKRFTRLAFILSSAAIISLSTAAHAGFEWKGPIEAPAPQPSAAPEMGGMSDLAPVTSDTPAPSETASPMPVESTPAAAIPAGEVLSGFAKDVPLVMALQQIVPPGYQYSFSTGVDAGTSVSWEGGKPWQGVLSDMLGSHGLGYNIQNSTIVVGAAQNNNAMPAPMPAQQDSMMMPMPGEPASPQSSSAPLNIVSQPPGSPQPVTTAPGAGSMGVTPAAPQKEEAVTIHREKPKSLLERLGFVRRKEADTPVAHEAPRQMAAANVPAPMPAAAPATVTDAPATAQPAAAMTAVPAASSWQGMKGQTLRDVLKAWSDKAGVDLYWSIDYDYRLSEDVGLAGSYEEAVGGLLDKFASVRPQPYGQLHQGSQGPRVLVIKSYDLAQ